MLDGYATEVNAIDRYYSPLDKLASNPSLLSRNKETPSNSEIQFPFSKSEYASKMASLGASWNSLTALHLNKLVGAYSDRSADALGIFSELHNKVSSEFKKRQVPENYLLLAPMLSGMNVHYVSADGKRGIWQLDIVTATRYGLEVSDRRDDRDDPVLAAAAAASYIKDLQSQFKSSDAVIWAYVSSPAEVRRAFSRAGSSQTEEASAFVPEYIQQANAVYNAWRFIWTYMDRNDLPVFTPAVFLPYENVITAEKTHLGQIADVLEIPLSSLKELNPSLKKQVAESKETIHLPQGYAVRFLPMAEAIAKHKDSLYFKPEVVSKPTAPTYATNVASGSSGSVNRTVKKYHKVKPGETLSGLAQRYHVSVASLKKWNHLKGSGIYAGQKIVVNVSEESQIAAREDKTVRENVQIEGAPKQTAQQAEESNEENVSEPEPAPVKTAPKPKTSAWIYYTVKSGDTLSSIGRKYGVVYTKIKEWNGLRSDKLSIGQKLKIKKS